MIRPISSSVDGDVFTCVFSQTKEEVANEIQALFASQKYKLESGNSLNGVYGVGKDILAVLFGAFAKRYKFPFEIVESEGNTKFTLRNGDGTKIFGGLIGVRKHKKEFEKLVRLIKGE